MLLAILHKCLSRFWSFVSHNLLSSHKYLVQVSLVLCSAAGVPHCDAVADNAFCCAPVGIP